MTELEMLRLKNDKMFAEVLAKIDKIVENIDQINTTVRKDLYEIEVIIGRVK